MDDQTKCEIYTKLLNSLNKNGDLKERITITTYNSQIILIKTDLLSKVISDQETALQMLKILIENNIQDIQRDVITILSDESIDQRLKSSILDSVRNYFKELLQLNNVTELASLYVIWKNFDLQKFYELLEKACSQEAKNTQDDSQLEPINFASLLIEHFLPMISSPDKANLKEPLIVVATKIAEMYPISNLSVEEYQEFLTKLPGFLTELGNLQNSNDNAWRETLHFLTKYLDEKLYSPEIQEMFNNSSLNWSLVQSDLEKNLNIELIKYISENNLAVVVKLYNDWKTLDPQKFTLALKEVCQNKEYIKLCKIFLFDKLIPVIMAPKDMCDPMKVHCIEIGLEFASTLPITRLSNEEYNKFISNVNDYILNICDLRDMNFEHWHKLWIFLVRFFGKKLHHSMTLINKLLRVVEHAFRNSSYEQRLRGYDCWKELIDNVSLDSQHLSSEKQIRLLLTPLRAKFSKQETLIIKRFEVFVYLIEKLQNKAVLVLKAFLEFCFGEVGEDTDPNKAGQGKRVSELWHRSAKVLLAILGHSHDSNIPCLDTSTEICLKGPIVNSGNISNYCCHVINSVAESCIMLKEVELNQCRNTVLKCFWTSLLRIVLDENVTKKEKCLETFRKVLGKLLKDNDPYCNGIAAEILRCTLTLDWSKVLPFIIHNLEYFNEIIFSVPLIKESYLEIEKFQIMLCTLESAEVTLKIINNMFDCFANYKTIESNVNFVAQFWIFLVNELDDYAKNKCLNFLVWPALHIHQITDSAKGALIYEHYKQIVLKCVEKSDELQLALFKNFEKILRNNPLLSKNVLTLVTMFTPKTDNKEITNVTLDILDLMMVVPVTEESDDLRQNMELYLKKLYESNVTSLYDHDTIKKLCTCLRHILKFRHYDILNIVIENLKTLPDNIKLMHGKCLSSDFLMDLFEKEKDIHATEKIHKLIDTFQNLKNSDSKKDITSFMPLGGRSAKIAKLVQQIPPSPGKRSDSPTPFRLFGKDIDTHSPLKLKGSQLKDMVDTPTKLKTSTPAQKQKMPVSIDDESTSKFVLIESEVKLDKNKLTEHQKEALRKRREDIPALYQDLSQSMMSQESSSVSKTDELDVSKKLEGKNKEIEVISNDVECENKQSTKVFDVATNQKTIIETGETQDQTDSTDKTIETKVQNKELDKKDIIKAAVEAELKKLSMSIVGAEEFLAANSKRKRREKKRDHEDNQEKSNKEDKNKETPKAEIFERDTEDICENPVTEKNEFAKPEEVVQARRGRRKTITKNKPESEISVPKETAPVLNTSSENQVITMKSDDSVEIPSETIAMENNEEKIKKKKGWPLGVKRKSLTAKGGSSETSPKGEKENKTKTSEDYNKLSGRDTTEESINKTPKQDNKQSHSTKENSNEASSFISTTEISKPSISIKQNSPESISVIIKGVGAVKKRGRSVKTPNVTKRKEWVEIKKNSSSTPVEPESVSDNEKQKRRRGRASNDSSSIDEGGKSFEVITKNSTPEKDVYQFDTEQERISESEIVPLRSPEKESKLKLDIKDNLSDEASLNQEKKKKARKSLIIFRASEFEETPPSGRKSKRKSVPTKKFTQSELFKTSESATHTLKIKNLISKISPKNKKKFDKNSLRVEKITQSEIFKNTDQNTASEISSDTPSRSTESDVLKGSDHQNSQENNAKRDIVEKSVDAVSSLQTEPKAKNDNLKSNATIFGKTVKRKRLSSEEDDDIIESSQESTTSNASAVKLKLSITKRYSIDKSLNYEVKQNIEEGKKIEEVSDNKIVVRIENRSSIRDVTPEVKKPKRSRRSKSQTIDDTFNVDGDKTPSSNTSVELQIEKKIESGSPPEEKRRRGRPPKSPVKNDLRESNSSERSPVKINDQKLHVATATQNDHSLTKVETKSEEKKLKRNKQSKTTTHCDISVTNTSFSQDDLNDVVTDIKTEDKPEEQIRDISDTTRIDVTPEERKGRRGRPKKSPAKSDDLFEGPTEPCENESIDGTQSFVVIGGNYVSVNEVIGVDVNSSEEAKSDHLRRKGKEESETIQTNILESDDTINLQPKKKRRRKNAEENESSEEMNDRETSGNSAIHVLTTNDRVTVEAFEEKPKRDRRKSPLKAEKESTEFNQEITQKVKKQIFTEKFKEPIDLNASTQNPKQRTQSQDTQTQDTESMNVGDDKIQLQLDLPQKPILNETDKEIASMDTASLPLISSGSFSEESESESNKTVMENRALTEDIVESENVINSSEETLTNTKEATDKHEVDKSNTVKEHLPESEIVVLSSEEINLPAESNEVVEIAETEDIFSTEILDTMNVQQIVEVEDRSPVREPSTGNCVGTPGALETSLPSSPVTGDTPNRTSELLNSTSDISPIGSKSCSDKSSSDDEFVEERKLIPIALKFDTEENDHDANKEKSPEKADDAPEKMDEMSPEKAEKDIDNATSSCPLKDKARTSRDIKNIAERSSRFFNMIKSGSPATQRLFSKRKSGHNMSPSASRIKKLMSNVKAPSQTEFPDNVSQEDILTFTREVPSPLAVPRSSILKRKHSEITDDAMSPCAKRKRVNFSDPCTTSKKVFIKEDNGPSQGIFGENLDDDVDKQFLEVLAANSIIDTPLTESEYIETEQSLQINNPFLLRDDIPIYPDLVDCEESVSVISRKLTSPMFVNALLSKLNSRNIKTIGDLAKQSEVSIARLPFKTPMVANVFKALDNYYHKNFKSKLHKDRNEPKSKGEEEIGNEVTVPLPRLEVALVKIDVKDELLKVLERAKSQDIPSETLCSLLFAAIDQKEILSYVKAHFNLETKDIVEKTEFPKIVKYITETVGLPKIFEILSESLGLSGEESVNFNCMIKHLIEKQPLSCIIQKISLQELQEALWKNVENETYTKEKLLDTCFLPFVNSIDLAPFFNKMTLVQIQDIVLTRLKSEDYPTFIRRILDKNSSIEVKEEILSHCSVSELTSNIIKKGSSIETISSFTNMFLSAEKDKEDLVQIFRLVSDSLVGALPPTELMGLSIEFQRKIPIKD